MDDQNMIAKSDDMDKLQNEDSHSSTSSIADVFSEVNQIDKQEISVCAIKGFEKVEHDQPSQSSNWNLEKTANESVSGKLNDTVIPCATSEMISFDCVTNPEVEPCMEVKNWIPVEESEMVKSHRHTKDNTINFKSEEGLENIDNSVSVTNSEKSKEDPVSDDACNLPVISPEESQCADRNDHTEVTSTTVSSSLVPTFPVDDPQLSKDIIESQILMKLNDVLSDLGFGFRKEYQNSTDVRELQNSIHCGNHIEVSQRIPPFSLQEFSLCLQDQLSKFKLDSEKFRDSHYSEVRSLEHALAQERSQLGQQLTKASQTITQLKNDLEKKQQLLDVANKDREGMVLKYAVSEKNVITVRKDLELAERRLREANRARDLLSDRLKTVQSEKEKANNLLETKGQEYSSLNRDNLRLKEDLRWTQNKLKTESDGKKEAEQRITDLIRRLEEVRLEAEQARKDAQNAIKAYQESQENKAVSLDQQLREQHARLILERHERADSEAVLKQLQAEVDSLKTKQQTLINENNQLSLKVQTLEKERLDGDQRLSRLKQENDKHHQEVADLRERLAGMESLRAQLQQYEDQLSTCRSEMERLRLTNMELQQDAAACREREAELLDFTQKLTEKNVRLQSEFSALEAKTQVLEGERQPLLRKLADAEGRLASLTQQLDEERRKRQEENSILARHLAEKTHQLEQVQQQLEDSQGEVEVLKRKHAASIRELTREIQLSRKREEICNHNSTSSQPSSNSSSSLAQGSRTSSSSSLNTVCETASTPAMPPVTFPNGQEPDCQTLIERLVKLQRENAKRAEKLDFMEEHSQVLVSELQKKTRLIQTFIMKMPAGALSSESMDQNKAELAKRTGIMASMYGSKNDEAMTLELSMEINRKLQAVLEDTLLKNITLKENLDTLGAEIARLSLNTTSH